MHNRQARAIATLREKKEGEKERRDRSHRKEGKEPEREGKNRREVVKRKPSCKCGWV